MALTKLEEFAKEVIELADKKSVSLDEFMYGLRLAQEITNRNKVSKQCLLDYVFPSQVEPPEVSELFSVQK